MVQSTKKIRDMRRIEIVIDRHEETYNEWLRKKFPKHADFIIDARKSSAIAPQPITLPKKKEVS